MINNPLKGTKRVLYAKNGGLVEKGNGMIFIDLYNRL